MAGELATARAAFEHRAAVVGTGTETLLAALTAFADGLPAAGVASGRVRRRGHLRVPGQGSQRPGMGQEPHQAFPVYATAFDEVCAHVDRTRPLAHPLAEAHAALQDRTRYAQPGRFAVESRCSGSSSAEACDRSPCSATRSVS